MMYLIEPFIGLVFLIVVVFLVGYACGVAGARVTTVQKDK